MKTSGLIGTCMLIAASAALLPAISVAACPQMPGPSGMSGGMYRPAADFDWVKHTQQTLDDLQGKLNLKPEQMPAWDTWAKGVMADANEQVKMDETKDDDKSTGTTSQADQTTPQRIARGIARLRAQTNWMQAHLTRLDAAQVRTQTFYDALEPEQKTIFDLFWTVMHHKTSGPGAWQMPMHRLDPRMGDDLNNTREQ
jgi:hypothetical protein